MSLSLKATFDALHSGRTLSEPEATSALTSVLDGSARDVQIGALLALLSTRLPTADELLGYRTALLETSMPLPLSKADCAMDLCGTGGDGKHSINISTLTSFVVTALGYPVIKHGNYAASSKVGSSNLLEALGVTLFSKPDLAGEQFEACNIVFLHAPYFYPALKRLAPLRASLGFRTIFNLLGPLLNPATPHFQVLGVPTEQLHLPFAESLTRLGRTFSVVSSLDGYDEVSLTAPVQITRAGGVVRYGVSDFGFQRIEPAELAAPLDLKALTDLSVSILAGRASTAHINVIAANTAVALSTCAQIPLAVAAQQARDCLLQGAPLEILLKLRSASEKLHP